MPRSRRLVFALTAVVGLAWCRASVGDDRVVIAAGPLTLEVSIARTAHLFHVVDQLSGWSPFCHRQYRDYFEGFPGKLDEADSDLLSRHSALRRVRGWGMGLEQAFYVDAGLDDALRRAVAAGHLTADEAATERAVFEWFAARVDRLIEAETPRLVAFRDRLRAEQASLADFARRLSRFAGGTAPTIPVFLMANPSRTSIGGGYNGGRLTIEVPTGLDAYPSFLHEVFHAFLEPSRPALERAAAAAPGLDYQTLNEGLAYAIAPGIIHPKGGSPDPLRDRVAADAAARKPLGDDYTRFNRLGLALRPGLAQALDDPGQTIDTFLPRAADAWAVVRELSRAWDGGPAQAGMRSFGPGWQALTDRMAGQGVPVWSANHAADRYRNALDQSRPDDPLVLLFAADHGDRVVPDAYRDLLPIPWVELEEARLRGRTVERAGRARGRRVVLLLAPTVADLEALIRRTPLLNP